MADFIIRTPCTRETTTLAAMSRVRLFGWPEFVRNAIFLKIVALLTLSECVPFFKPFVRGEP